MQFGLARRARPSETAADKEAKMQWDVEIDCAGLLCPLPVLRARKRLMAMAAGEVLRVLATDKMAAIDLPHFCAQSGHELLDISESCGNDVYLIRRGA
jgi:tRNA 2-thiouridine synthesizing protein A